MTAFREMRRRPARAMSNTFKKCFYNSQVVCRGVVGSIGKELFHIIRESKGAATSHDICGMVSIREIELIFLFKKSIKLYPGKRVYGKDRYADTVRYSQIQNALARVFKHSRESV